jgi:hypothetical protein
MKKEKNEPIHSERVKKILEQFKTRIIDGQKVSNKEFSEYFIKIQLEHLKIEELGSFQKFLNQEEESRKIRRVKSGSESTNSAIETKPKST